jgi:hypothetical protein
MKKFLALILGFAWVACSIAGPTVDDIVRIRARFTAEGLQQASVEPGLDGRLRLVGQYKDRAQVQLAFNLAQQVVGVRWVAPTTPENVRYPGTEGIKTGILDALRKSRPVKSEGTGSGEVHALVVGVGHYEMRNIRVLPNAGNDAKMFYNYLSDKSVKRENMTLLLEEQATKAQVDAALSSLKSRIKPNDTAVLYFSTHGNKPNDLGNMAVVLHDSKIDVKRRWIDPSTALQDDEIKRFIETVSPARVMIVLDICYSGAAFAKVPGFLVATSKDLFVEEETYSTGMDQRSLNYFAGQNREQEKILIAASGPGEKSWESAPLKQSYFTYYFVQELRRRNEVQGAFDAAKPIIQSAVNKEVSAQENSPVTQTPQATFIPDAANLKF